MPSSSGKQHRLMSAVAHNQAFAKKVGIPQSVGKDFSAADKGKFGRGGMAAINKQNTQHGSMDMPFKSLKRFAGMKEGGKLKRFDDGGKTTGFGSKSPAAQNRATIDLGYEIPNAQSKEQNMELDTRAVGRPLAQKWAENRAENAGFLKGEDIYPKEARLQKNLASPARMARKAGVYLREKYGDVKGNVEGMMGDNEALQNLRGRQLSREQALGYQKGGMAKPVTGMKKGDTVKMARGGMPQDAMAAMMARRAAMPPQEMPSKDAMAAMMPRRRPRMGAGMPPPAPPVMPSQPTMGMKKGGMTRKFGKGGMHKMPDGKMMKNSAMNMGGMAGYNKGGMAGYTKGGMPMKDGKPAFMQKKMNMGGMAKYAGGGGIESRGKTKGTVIRMASGGSVSSASRRADGIAQRGKTRC